MIENLSTAGPVEIDTRIAELHEQIARVTATIRSLTNSVLDHAGLRVYVSATWETRRSSYRTTGSFEDGVAILTAYGEAMDVWRAAGYPADARVEAPSNYAGSVDVEATVVKRRAALNARFALWAEANELNAEFNRRPWSRYFLVVSSAGHIHSSTSCQTCRLTTVFGWMPERSGQAEIEAIKSLGKHADALCSVCFPSAPVAVKRTNVTKAGAVKLATATVVNERDED